MTGNSLKTIASLGKTIDNYLKTIANDPFMTGNYLDIYGNYVHICCLSPKVSDYIFQSDCPFSKD